MAAEVTTELKIPDLWYDFYARLIPGLIFIAAFRYYSLGYTHEPSGTELIILIIAAYVIGVIVNPISTWLVSKIYYCVNPLKNEEDLVLKNWVEDVQKRIGRESRDSLILSKMHGEINLFAQLFVLTLIFLAQHITKAIPGFNYEGRCDFRLFHYIGLSVFAIFFFWAAYSVAKRQFGRAEKYALLFNYRHITTALKKCNDSSTSKNWMKNLIEFLCCLFCFNNLCKKSTPKNN